MTMVGYWVPSDADKGAGNTLVYLLAFPSRAARDKAWADFQADPEWVAVRKASEVDGKLTDKVDSLHPDRHRLLGDEVGASPDYS